MHTAIRGYGPGYPIIPAMRLTFITLLAALALATAGPAGATDKLAASLAPRDLLAAAFPAWHPGSHAPPPHKAGTPREPAIRRLALPGLAWPWLPQPGRQTTGDLDTHVVQITPLAVVPIDATHAALLTVAEPVGGDCHYGCVFEAGVYFFARDGDGWRLRRRIDLAQALYGDLPDKLPVRPWPGHGVLLSMARESCYQDACAGQLDLFGFAPDRLLFAFETSISLDAHLAAFTSGDGADHDCGEILDKSFEPEPGATFDPVSCHQETGTWRIAGDGIDFTFRGGSREVDGEGHLGRLSRTVTHARVELRDEGLVLVKGELPTFGI